MAVERDDFILGFEADLSGLREYLSAIKSLPNAVDQVAAKVTGANFGGSNISAQQGKKLAGTILRAFENELKGGASFERTLKSALGKLDFGIPPQQLAKLRQQLSQISKLSAGPTQQVRKPIGPTPPAARPAAPAAPAPQPARSPIAKTPKAAKRSGGGGDDDEGLSPRDREIKQLRAALKEITDEELTRQRIAQKILEIERGITQQIEAQGAATRKVNAQLTPQEAEKLAQQGLSKKRAQAAVPDDEFALIEQANRTRIDANAQRQRFRNEGGIIGAAKASSISPDGASPAEQFARTARGVTAFTLTAFPLYTAMNLVTSSLREATQGTLEYEDSLSKLAVSLSTEKGGLRDFASQIGSVSNSFGLSQADGIEAASRGVGAFGIGADSGLSRNDQQDFLSRAIKTAGQINYQSGSKDLVSTQQNIAGTLRSFNLANDQIEQVADSTTVVSKRFGILAADLLNTTAQIGTQADAAGFTLEQTQAIIANQAKNTGQTPDAVAGFFSQVLSQADSSNVARKLSGVGVDTDNTTLAQQIQQLSQLVAQGQISQARLNDVSSAFGRGRSSQALQILVRDFAKIQATATEAKNSPGASEKIFNQLFNNINAEFRKLLGNVRGIITEVAQSGLLDFLGALLVTTEKVTAVIYELLQIFNQIPRPLRTGAFLFLEIAGALKLISKFGGVAKIIREVSAAFGATFNVFRSAQAGQAAQTAAEVGGNLAGVGRTRAAAQNIDRAILAQTLNTPVSKLKGAQLASSVRGAGSAAASSAKAGGSAALALLGGPAGAAALVVTLASAGVFDSLRDRSDTNRAVDRADKAGNTATTAEQLRAASAAQRDAADKARAEQRGGFNLRTIGTLGIAPLIANTIGAQEGQVADAKRKAAELDAAAARLEQQKSGKVGTAAAFGDFSSVDDIKKAFDDLDAAAYSASEQLDLVSSAMDALTEKATSTAAAIIPEGGRTDFANTFGSIATKSVQDAINQAELLKGAASGSNIGPLSRPGSDFRAAKKDLETLKGIDTNDLRSKTTAYADEYLNKLGKTGTGEQGLTEDELAILKQAQYNFIKGQLDSQLNSLPEALRKTLLQSIKIYTKQDIDGRFGNTTNGAKITPDMIKNSLGAASTAADKVFATESPYNKLGATQAKSDTLGAAIEAAQTQQLTLTGKDFEDAGRLIKQAQEEFLLINTDLTKQLQAVAASRSKLKIVKSRGDDSAALLKNQIDTLKGQRSGATDEQEIADLDLQIAEAQNQKRHSDLDLLTASQQSRRDPRNLAGQAKDAVAAARRAVTDAKANGGPLQIAQAQTALNEAIQQQRDTGLAISKAKAASRVQPGDAVAAAQLALTQAKQDKDAALKGSQAYYEALVAIAAARKEVAASINQRRYNKDLLKIDLTDPVAQANADVRDAKRQLASAQGPDDKDAARISLKNKRNTAEAAAFNQRLSDVQTADELGRISHQAYLSYLQNEHNRLGSIGKRTRQQQDELDQIDKLMKSAADELNGQFNLGSIKLPTVYEVRRAIAAGSSGVGNIAKYQTAQNQVSVTNTNFTFNGAPLDQILKYLQAAIGTNATKTRSTGGR